MSFVTQACSQSLVRLQLFCDDKRAELKAANPETPFTEMAKLLGAAWKEATPDEKAKYQEQHAVCSCFQTSKLTKCASCVTVLSGFIFVLPAWES